MKPKNRLLVYFGSNGKPFVADAATAKRFQKLYGTGPSVHGQGESAGLFEPAPPWHACGCRATWQFGTFMEGMEEKWGWWTSVAHTAACKREMA